MGPMRATQKMKCPTMQVGTKAMMTPIIFIAAENRIKPTADVAAHTQRDEANYSKRKAYKFVHGRALT